MTITTWLHDRELNVPTGDNHIDELFSEVRKKTGDTWQITCRTVTQEKRFLSRKKPTEKTFYTLYAQYGGNCYQMINFFVLDSDTTINTWVDKSIIMAYLYGILAGMKNEK